MPFQRFLLLPAAVCVALASGLAQAQELLPESEGVFRTEFADVLRAEPVYPAAGERPVGSHCVTATTSQGREQPSLVQRLSPSPRAAQRSREGEANAVVFSADVECSTVLAETGTTPSDVPRPLAWDVDYILRGIKYRSRLPYDPGTRLRVRVSVTPVIQPFDSTEQP